MTHRRRRSGLRWFLWSGPLRILISIFVWHFLRAPTHHRTIIRKLKDCTFCDCFLHDQFSMLLYHHSNFPSPSARLLFLCPSGNSRNRSNCNDDESCRRDLRRKRKRELLLETTSQNMMMGTRMTQSERKNGFFWSFWTDCCCTYRYKNTN